MRKRITLAALCVLCALIFSTTTMAYDDLITNDTAAVIATGGLCGSASLSYLTASKRWDYDGNSVDLSEFPSYSKHAKMMRIPLRINYGVMDNLTTFAILPVVSLDRGFDSNSGIGDLWLGAKYAVIPEGVLTVRSSLDIPLGDDNKNLGNDGGLGIDMATMTIKEIDKICLNGQIGVRWNNEGPKIDIFVEEEDVETGEITSYKTKGKYTPGIGVYADVEGSYNFTEGFKGLVGIEFMTVGDGKLDGEEANISASNYFDLNFGASYKLGEKMNLRGDIIQTITGKNNIQYTGVLLSLVCTIK